ncbi:MAG: hypothetical protein DMF88_14290 [Acidobacteria bacterium]|nr:MAG: hypothetical protein DMF88_14290 [Acidobacteriota bacterium]
MTGASVSWPTILIVSVRHLLAVQRDDGAGNAGVVDLDRVRRRWIENREGRLADNRRAGVSHECLRAERDE